MNKFYHRKSNTGQKYSNSYTIYFRNEKGAPLGADWERMLWRDFSNAKTIVYPAQRDCLLSAKRSRGWAGSYTGCLPYFAFCTTEKSAIFVRSQPRKFGKNIFRTERLFPRKIIYKDLIGSFRGHFRYQT